MRYTRRLAEALAIAIYGIAKTHDEPLDDVHEEAKRILNIADRPAKLFNPHLFPEEEL